MAAAVKRLLSPEEWKKRQLGTLSSVGASNYKVGIAGPRKDPIAAGIDAQDRYENEMRKGEVLARRKEALQKTSMAEWYKYASELGAARLVEGVTKREAKVSDFIQTWHPLLTSHVGKVDALSVATDGDRETKMLENLRGLKALKGKA